MTEAEEFRISSDIKQANLELVHERLNEAVELLQGHVKHGDTQGWRESVSFFLASLKEEGFTHYPELLESVQPIDAMLRAEGAQGERDAFEAWVKTFNSVPAALFQDERERYIDDWIQRRWMGWQARAALAQPSPAPELFDALVGQLSAELKFDRIGVFEAAKQILDAHNRIIGALLAERDGAIKLLGQSVWQKIERLTQERDAATQCQLSAEQSISSALGENAVLRERLEAAQARVAELENQEPFCLLYRIDGEPVVQLVGDPHIKDGMALYADPVAQAGQVPDGFALVPANPLEWPLAIGAAQLCKSMSVGCDDEDALHDAMVDMLAAIAAAPAQGGE